MQVSPFYPRHVTTKECKVGEEQRRQREVAITLALALWQEFSIHGDVLEQVEVFKNLGSLLPQEDEDIRAIHAQLRKSRATWACVGHVLRSKNASPQVTAKFYKAMVQAMSLYGSKMLLEESAQSYSEARIHLLTHVSVDRAYQAESVGSNFSLVILFAIRRSPIYE